MPPAAVQCSFQRRRDDPSFLSLVFIAIFVNLSARYHVTGEAVKIDVSCSCTKSRNKVMKKPATCKKSQNKASYTACCNKAYGPLTSTGMDCTFAAVKKDKSTSAKGSKNSTLKLGGGSTKIPDYPGEIIVLRVK